MRHIIVPFASTQRGAPPPPTGFYTTNFDQTENPISEGGVWSMNGLIDGLDWTAARSSGGIAYGTQSGSNNEDDSISLLGNLGFGQNVRASAVISFTGSRSAGTQQHEVELMLNTSFSAHNQFGYEFNVGYNGATGWAMQIVRFDGVLGNHTTIESSVNSVPDIANGDVFMVERVGSTLNSYINGVLIKTATDSTYLAGYPGIGFFWRGTENISDFGYTSFTATNI